MRAPPTMKFTGRPDKDITVDKAGGVTIRPRTSSGAPGPGDYHISTSLGDVSPVSRGKTSFGMAGRDASAIVSAISASGQCCVCFVCFCWSASLLVCVVQRSQSPGPAAYDSLAAVVAPTSKFRASPNTVFSKSPRDNSDRCACHEVFGIHYFNGDHHTCVWRIQEVCICYVNSHGAARPRFIW